MLKLSARWLAVLLFFAACSSNKTGGTNASTTAGTNAGGGSNGSAGSTGTGGASSGTSSSSGGSSGTTGCALGQLDCGGTCVNPKVDPDHCGSCANACDAGSACSAGVCAATCQAPLQVCSRACVDVGSDNQNCGVCGNPCGPNKGCVDGACQDVIAVGPGPNGCAGGGPPIFVSDAGALGCAGNLAQVTFRWALCSCSDVALSQSLLTDGFDSSVGPYAPAGNGGGVGVNGQLQSSSDAEVWGALWASGTNGIGTNDLLVKLDLRSGGQWRAQSANVAGDAFVDGDIDVSQASTVTGALHQPAGAQLNGPLTAGSTVTGPVTVAPPCDCDPKIPVSAIVAAHASANDDALVGLSPSALSPPPGDVRLDLPCGSYYLSAIQASRAITIVSHGNTALYIDGDVSISRSLAILPDPGSQLDVFIAGELSNSSQLTLGSPNYPAQMRVYLSGRGGSAINLSATADLAANLYAANGRFQTSGDLLEYGSIIAGTYESSGQTAIHFDRAVVGSGAVCSQADAGFVVPAPDAGSTGGGCTSCRDCGNQACVNGTCGACTTSADCCAPLGCLNGTCQIIFR